MERRSEKTKALLGEEFKELVVEKSFEKITIKMITDAAGVIRPTFYNYFQDKYEVMEWLLWEDVFQSVTELISMDMALEAMKMLFRKIGADKAYYRKVFEVEGQNSFEEMLYQRIYDVARQLIEKHPLKWKRTRHHQRGDILKIPVYHFGQWGSNTGCCMKRMRYPRIRRLSFMNF